MNDIPPRAFPPAHTVAAEVVEEYAQNMMNEGHRLSAEIAELKAENARYRTALEFYALNKHVPHYFMYGIDIYGRTLDREEFHIKGEVAREALRPLPPKPEGEPDADNS